MITFEDAHEVWWQKPLVFSGGKVTTAELAILSLELERGESGVWMNSRGTKTGVVDIQVEDTNDHKAYKTIRKNIPQWLSGMIEQIYSEIGFRKGCPDLAIWSEEAERCRMIEVKCPIWDRISQGQLEFINTARLFGIETKVVEWVFKTSTLNQAI